MWHVTRLWRDILFLGGVFLLSVVAAISPFLLIFCFAFPLGSDAAGEKKDDLVIMGG